MVDLKSNTTFDKDGVCITRSGYTNKYGGFVFSTEGRWTATPSESWCKVTPNQGTGVQGVANDIKVVCDENLTSFPRHCEISVKGAQGQVLFTVPVEQYNY